MKRLALMAAVGGFAVGAVVLGLFIWRDWDFPRMDRGRRPPPGRPAAGLLLASDEFRRWLPPAPADALPYEIAPPLFNGPDIAEKRRWLWVPPGQVLREIRGAAGYQIKVPAGTRLWKEFWLTTGRGQQLVERRLIERVPDGQGFNGWRFYKAHYLPERPSHQLSAEEPLAGEYFLSSDDWLPTQPPMRAVSLTLREQAGTERRYVFPGNTQCGTCHAGAQGFYPEGSGSLSFGLADLLRTQQMRAALLQRGWLVSENPPGEERPVSHDALQAKTDRLVGVMRHNCLSCHNASPEAAARNTGFVLDPRREYSAQELWNLLSRRGVMQGTDTHPLVAPGTAHGGELFLRLRGEADRRRMPPSEGGVTSIHEVLLKQLEAWVDEVSAVRGAQ